MECNFTRIDGDQIELVLEKNFAQPPEKVWQVLTEREFLRQWFPCDVAGKWSVGETLRFTFPEGQHEGLSEKEMRGEVLLVDPPKQLEFTWGQYKYRCELTAEGDGCNLRFIESFTHPSEGARNAAGWEMCIENLDLILQGLQIAIFALKVWKPKFDKYVRKFEPELGEQKGAPESEE